MINPTICILSGVSRLLWGASHLLLLKEQQGPYIIFQSEHTYICLAELSFTNYAKNTTCSLDGPGYFLQRGCVCDYIHHSRDTCGLEWQKTFADPGQWSLGQRGLPVCLCTSSHRCCQRTRQHVDLSAGYFPADLSTYDWKYDLQLTSGRVVP